MKRFFPGICCFFMLFTIRAAAQSTAEKEVLTLERQRFAAMVAADTVFLQRVLAEDLLYSHSTGFVDNKRSLIRSIATKALDYQAMELQNVESRTYNGTVILNGSMVIKVASEGKLLDMKVKYLDVYRKKGKVWQLVAWQSAKLN